MIKWKLKKVATGNYIKQDLEKDTKEWLLEYFDLKIDKILGISK